MLSPKAHDDNNKDPWLAFRAVKNKIKSVITEKRREFLCRAVPPKRPKEKWKVILINCFSFYQVISFHASYWLVSHYANL